MTIYLSENIKRLRLEKELTQETLSEFLGVTSLIAASPKFQIR